MFSALILLLLYISPDRFMESFARFAKYFPGKPERHSTVIEYFIIFFVFHCFFMQDQVKKIIAIACIGFHTVWNKMLHRLKDGNDITSLLCLPCSIGPLFCDRYLLYPWLKKNFSAHKAVTLVFIVHLNYRNNRFSICA